MVSWYRKTRRSCPQTQVGMNTATLVITICVVLVALGLGILFGIFFTKRNYS